MEAVAARRALALNALVFGAGTGALATEITASRLLEPYFGSSTIVWANLIGLVLAALALGYWLGGRGADRHPSPALLGFLVLGGALCIAAIPFVAKPFLDVTVQGLDRVSLGAVVGSFFSVLLLFAPPVVLLGMVSPFAIRLAVSASFLLGIRYAVIALALGLLVLVPPGAVKAQAGVIHEETSLYQYIQVVQRPDGRRLLYLNEGVAVHSVWRPHSVLTGGEWDAYLALPPLLERPLRSVAILGNAGGTTARALGVYYPKAAVDAV